jgi:hypothetical protein
MGRMMRIRRAKRAASIAKAAAEMVPPQIDPPPAEEEEKADLVEKVMKAVRKKKAQKTDG